MSSELPPDAAQVGAATEGSQVSMAIEGSQVSVAIEGFQAAVDDFDREVARLLGVSETGLRCLEILVQEVPEATPRLLADRLGLTTGSVTSLLDRLETLGYLTRSPHPSDRRKLIVRATETASTRAWELMGPMVTEGQQQLLTRYSAEQLSLITDFLTRARDLQQIHTERLRQRDPYPRA